MRRGGSAESDEARRAAAVRALEAARLDEVSSTSPSPSPESPPRPPRSRGRTWWLVGIGVLVVAVIAGVVVLGGSGGGDGDDSPVADAPAVTVAGDSSGSAPVDSTTVGSTARTLSPLVGSSPPPLDLTNDDLSAVALQILAFRSWLLANPDPALTSEIFVPASPAFETFRAELADLRDAGRVVLFEGLRPRVTSVLAFGNAEVDVAVAFDARIVYDAETGAEVSRELGGTLPVTLKLTQGPDARWRATDLEFVS